MHIVYTQIAPERVYTNLIAWVDIGHILNSTSPLWLLCEVTQILKGRLEIILLSSDRTCLYIDSDSLYERRGDR